MTNPIVKIHDLVSGEEIEREMTESELLEKLEKQESFAAHQAEQEAKEAARQSALDKLAALGLSPEEIAAITGA